MCPAAICNGAPIHLPYISSHTAAGSCSGHNSKARDPLCISQRQRLRAPSLWAPFCGVLPWWGIRPTALASQVITWLSTAFPTEHCFPLFLLHVPFAFLCCLFGHWVLHTRSHPINPAEDSRFFSLPVHKGRMEHIWQVQPRWCENLLVMLTALCPGLCSPGAPGETAHLGLLRISLLVYPSCLKTQQIFNVWCHLTASANECKWHKEHVEQMEWDMHVKN